jgi:hypothetical protein
VNLDEDERFTDGGYVVRTDDRFTEHFISRGDLPDEYRIFAYPEPEKSIKKALESYRQTIGEADLTTPSRPQPSNGER